MLPAEDAARALLARGSVREGIALLRAVIARDREEEGCMALLAHALAGGARPEALDTRLELSVVDAWIRRGMLVEALALLSGTEMGSDETGHEWANLLGELLAPVPAHAEPTLVEMHRQLLSGGASVALMLLGERALREPSLPAWAMRRLEILRWMLLDNASSSSEQESDVPPAPTALAAAIAPVLRQRNLVQTLSVARLYSNDHPDDLDCLRLIVALDALVSEIERHASSETEQARTLPMFGRPAAAMQLRMGNLPQAALVYRKLAARASEADDPMIALLSAEVDTVMRAAAGQPIADLLEGEPTRNAADPFLDHGIEATTETTLEAIAAAIERSGPRPTPSIEDLLAQGRLQEAHAQLRNMAAAYPNEPIWTQRADELEAELRKISIHAIRPVGRER